MNHLLLPTNPEHISLTVPCLDAESYKGPFTSYLEQRNLTEAHILTPEKYGMPQERAMCHLQTWLFFGTLTELSFQDQDHTSFQRLQELFVLAPSGDEIAKTLSTQHLCAYWAEIELQVRAASQYEQDQYRYKIISVVQLSNRVVADIDQDVLSPPHRAVVLSVILLNEFIMDSADLREIEMERPYFRSLSVESAMHDRRWCPSDIERLRLDFDVSALVFAAHCGAPSSRRDHGSCSLSICEARQILRTEEYIPRHAAGLDCNCEHVPVDRDTLLRSLDKGLIPVCRFHDDSETDPLQTMESSQVSRYVAISHVWSDRLGNKTANALPRCLLKYLQEKVDSLYQGSNGHIAFWMDTLSCPVEPASARDQAISLIPETYGGADKVLVLDSYLEALNIEHMTVFERALRITCTGWTRRLWTLQEGVLAKTIFFQFANAAIDGDALFRRLAQPPISYRTAPILHSWMEIRSSWDGSSDSPMIGGEFVYMLYRALRFRSTSVATDEPVCLSTLAGVDLKEIVKEKKESRMRRFWQLNNKLSTALLYWDGPRLNYPGLRWAPASLLSASPEAFMAYHADLITKAKEVTPTDEGIIFCSAGILLGEWKAPIQKTFWLRDENDTWYHVTLTQSLSPPRTEALSEPESQQSPTPAPPTTLALLMHTTLEQAFRDISSWPGQKPTCVLISIHGSNPEFVSARFESIGVISQVDTDKAGASFVSMVADAIEAKLRAKTEENVSDPLSAPPDNNTSAEDGDRQMRDSPRTTTGPETIEHSLPVDDLDVAAFVGDGRLNLIMSGNHVMFHGRPIPPSECFCLG